MALYHITLPIAGFFSIWIGFSLLVYYYFSTPAQLRRKRITLLISHPDDEAMFFAPSVLALSAPMLENDFHIACLSTGNAIGEGPVRVRELVQSARRLGVPEGNVQVLDDPRFQDGPRTEWKADDIVAFLKNHYDTAASDQGKATATATGANGQTNVSTQRRSLTTDEPEITPETLEQVIVTFDKLGISKHPNHCACYYGAVRFLEQLPEFPSSPAPLLYVLPTLPKWRKYMHIFDVPLTLLATRGSTPGTHAIFLSDSSLYLSAFGAMTKAHQTQMAWFRWGWVLLGRYMLLNELVQVEVPAGGREKRAR